MISSREGRPSLEPGFLPSFSGFAYMPIVNPMAERKISIFFSYLILRVKGCFYLYTIAIQKSFIIYFLLEDIQG